MKKKMICWTQIKVKPSALQRHCEDNKKTCTSSEKILANIYLAKNLYLTHTKKLLKLNNIGIYNPTKNKHKEYEYASVKKLHRWKINSWKNAQYCLLLESCELKENEIPLHTYYSG